MHLIRAGQVCGDRAARGCGTDTVAADAVSRDEDFCPPLVGGQACCCHGEFEMTFYSDFTIQMILNIGARQELCNAGG